MMKIDKIISYKLASCIDKEINYKFHIVNEYKMFVVVNECVTKVWNMMIFLIYIEILAFYHN